MAFYDAVIIGAGHNGLVTAGYLGKAGKKVLVLERRHVVGGAAVTEELMKGFHFSRCSYVCSLFRPQIVRELELRRFGYHVYARDPSSFTPALDSGKYLVIGKDPQATRDSIAQFSNKDATQYAQYEAMLEEFVGFLQPLLDRSPPQLEPGALLQLDSLSLLAKLGLDISRKGPEFLPQLVELLTAPAADILRRWFESPILLATLATDSVIGAMTSPASPGSGYVLLHHMMGETDGRKGVWGYARGGMGGISQALRKSAEANGVQVRTDSPVREILVENGRAAGVLLESGEVIRAAVTISNAHPKTTFLSLVANSERVLPETFRKHIEGTNTDSCVTKINLALDRLPSFTCLKGNNSRELRGTIHFESDLETIERAFQDALLGKCSERPIIEMTLPSTLDPTLAPPGKHVASLFVQYTPYRLRDQTWTPELKNALLNSVLNVIEDYAPGFKSSVLFSDVLSPVDLEAEFGLLGGNIFHMPMGLHQLYWNRPAPAWAQYSAPISDLFLCGAGCHPGGGVSGAPGRNCANVVLKHLH